jgi:branched-chain amino acid transport system ATP-binding protein
MENGGITQDDTVDKLRVTADVKVFQLGLTETGVKKIYRDVKHSKRRNRWLT